MWWMSDSCRWRNWGSEKFTDLSEVAWLITGRVKMPLPVLPLTPACFTLHLSASSSGVISWGGLPAWLRRSLCFYAKCRPLSHKIWERNKEEPWNTLNPGNEAYWSSPGALHTVCELWEHNLLCLSGTCTIILHEMCSQWSSYRDLALGGGKDVGRPVDPIFIPLEGQGCLA